MFSRDEITSVPAGIRVSPHEPTINDVLIVLDFAGSAPREVLLVGLVPETLEGGMTLSPRVAGAVKVTATAARLVLERACRVEPRQKRSARRLHEGDDHVFATKVPAA